MKWIRAIDLERWAGTIVSRKEFPGLVSSLIRASAPNASSFRFPSGDSAETPGYDGTLDAKGVPPYIPEGKSVWEFGTSADYLQKANDDYKTRTDNPRSAVREETTFVFVTARQWRRDKPSLEEWRAQKQHDGPWKAIKVIDAVALEDWFERCPAAAARARRTLGITPGDGVQSTDEFWDEYAGRFKKPVSESVLLCGREEQAKLLIQQLLSSAGYYPWQADSPEEVIAFAVAAVRSTAHDERKFLESRTLVVETKDAARQLALRENMVFLPLGGALESEGPLGRRNPTVVPLGRDRPTRPGATTLKRPTTQALSKALEAMNIEAEEASLLARTCGRSVTILARRFPSGNAKKPEWDGSEDLLPALTAGAWNAASEADQNVLEYLAGTSYADYEEKLAKFIHMQDPPLEREGAVWKVRAPVDMFVHLGRLFGNKRLERLAAAADNVFSELDPSLALSPEEQPYAALNGKVLKHSEWLREGIATMLLLVASFHEEADLYVPGGAENFVNQVVEKLPGLKEDWRVIASLQAQLPLLIEAAPRPLAAALGQLLEGDGSRIRPIFRDTSGLFASSPHTGLLWALEVMAWDPEQIGTAVLLLAKLARADPGGKLANRPLGSLREIFLPWHPCTNANLRQRLEALDGLTRHEPTVGWELTLKLLPTQHDTTGETASPRYREAGASDKDVLTRKLVWEGYAGIMERALAIAGNDASRWGLLVPAIPNFAILGPAHFSRVCDALENFLLRASPEQRGLVWPAMNELVNQHKAFRTAGWAMKESDLNRLATIADRFAPPDPLVRAAWLFNDHLPPVPGRESGPRIEDIDKARQAAVGEIYEVSGIGAIISLAAIVKLPRQVAIAAANVIHDPTECDGMIDATLGKSETLDEFATFLSAQTAWRFEMRWKELMTARWRDRRSSTEQMATLFLYWRDELATWQFVGSFGPEVEQAYWKRKGAWPLAGEPGTIELGVRMYLSAGRALSAIQAVGQEAGLVSTELLFEVLDSALLELSPSTVSSASMLSYKLGLIFESLRHRPDIEAVEIAKREYEYLPLLERRKGELTLNRLLAESPELFVSVLCQIFRPSTGEAKEPTDLERTRARAGYNLLSQFHKVPGEKDAQIDTNVLTQWVKGARTLAAEQDRARIADQQIGHILAHAPIDPDGVWPHRAVRDLIEALKSEDVELGIQVERVNMRGVVTKAMYEGGNQERALASEVRQWADAMGSWPRTHEMLIKIAQGWEFDGDKEDERARQDEMRYE